jgi:hypothetical protein
MLYSADFRAGTINFGPRIGVALFVIRFRRFANISLPLHQAGNPIVYRYRARYRVTSPADEVD